MSKILITGGLGFIGSNLIRYWMQKYPSDYIINLDSHTYAARPDFLQEFLASHPALQNRYTHERMDISHQLAVSKFMKRFQPDHVIHLAAESHVCRSIAGPRAFIHSNVVGTFNLLEEFKELWGRQGGHRFHYVSTDEVFGELGPKGKFSETTPLAPRSPYAASKACGDFLVNCYHETYGLDTVITNCSNNYGLNQHEEKLIPHTIWTMAQGKEMTVYGDGTHVRDWLHVNDHARAIDKVFRQGVAGERYCVGGDMEMRNIDMIQIVAKKVSQFCPGLSLKLLFTNDRPTDDARYAIDISKLRALGWEPRKDLFDLALEETVEWYLKKLDALL